MKTLVLIGLLFVSFTANAQKITFSHLASPTNCQQSDGSISFITSGIYYLQSVKVTYTIGAKKDSMEVMTGIGGMNLSNLTPGKYSNFIFSYKDRVSTKNIIINLNKEVNIPAYEDFLLKITKTTHAGCTMGSIGFKALYSADGNPLFAYTYNQKEYLVPVNVVNSEFTINNLSPGEYKNFSLRNGDCITKIHDIVQLENINPGRCIPVSVKKIVNLL